MVSQFIKIANAGGFWGDSTDAAWHLIRKQPDLDFITIDYLAELSLAIMAIQRERDPTAGFARDFVDVVRSLAPVWCAGSRVQLVANAGGLNPQGCAQACAEVLAKAGCSGLKIGVVTGDDVRELLLADAKNPLYRHLEDGQSLQTVGDRLVAANAYLGAEPVAEALRLGAQIVITGRVADPSLTVGPCLAHFGWSKDNYAAIAGATIAGHLIECGTQVTGGISTHWLDMPDHAHIGFPIVEIDAHGDCVVTKPARSGGRVSEETVKEQLLYEIGDPARYLSPDATVSFLDLVVSAEGVDRVAVRQALGSAPPSTYKVSASTQMGFRAEGQLVIVGDDVVRKARLCGQIVLQRVRDAGYELDRSLIEFLGAGDVIPGVLETPKALREVVLRISVADRRREAVERFTKELSPLVTSGPQGTTGYATGRPRVRPCFGYWPCLIERGKLQAKVSIVEVGE